MCTPSKREGHIGQEWVPGKRQSRRLAEKHKNIPKHTLLQMCTPSKSKAHFEVIRTPGEHQSPRYAELFVVAFKGLAGTTLANQGRSHEARGLLRDGQRSANHQARLSFQKNHQNHVFWCTLSRQTIHFGEERAPGERQSRCKAENYRTLQKYMCLKRCAPSRREGHLGRFGVFGPSWKTPPASKPHSRLR